MMTTNETISKEEFYASLNKVLSYLKQEPNRLNGRYKITSNTSGWYNCEGWHTYDLVIPMEKCNKCGKEYMYDPDDNSNILGLEPWICEPCEQFMHTAVYYTVLASNEVYYTDERNNELDDSNNDTDDSNNDTDDSNNDTDDTNNDTNDDTDDTLNGEDYTDERLIR